MLNGFFRDNSKDIGKLHIILDPFLITLLFNFIYKNIIYYEQFGMIRIIVFLITYFFLSSESLYKSYRYKSIFSVILSVLKLWIFLFLFFISLDYLFLDSIFLGSFSIWAISSFLVLIMNHAGVRFLLRFFRKKGRNSRNYIFFF